MTATISDNGVVRISRKGMVKFAIGEDEPFILDVIDVHDQWYQSDWSMRDKDGAIPRDQQVGWNENRRAFFQTITQQAYQSQLPGKECPVLTHAEAGEFLAKIQEEATRLRSFFFPKSPDQPSSPQATAMRFQM